MLWAKTVTHARRTGPEWSWRAEVDPTVEAWTEADGRSFFWRPQAG